MSECLCSPGEALPSWYPWADQQLRSPIPSVCTADGSVPAGPALGKRGAAAQPAPAVANSAPLLPFGTGSAQPVPGEPDLKQGPVSRDPWLHMLGLVWEGPAEGTGEGGGLYLSRSCCSAQPPVPALASVLAPGPGRLPPAAANPPLLPAAASRQVQPRRRELGFCSCCDRSPTACSSWPALSVQGLPDEVLPG